MKMFRNETRLLLVMVLFPSTGVLAGCTGATPGYCASTSDCEPGSYCNLARNACEPHEDIGVAEMGPDGMAVDAPLGQEGGVDLPSVDAPVVDGPAADTLPPDLVKPDTGKPPTCSDGVKNQPSEVCDGKDLDGQTCAKQGYDGGTLVCAADCKSFIKAGCFKCGDKKKNPGEECDGTDFGASKPTCKQKGFECGAILCTSKCTISTAGCKKGWATKIPGDITAIATDGSGNSYITGTFTSPATFGTTKLSGSNIFIAKLSSEGKILWATAPTGDVMNVRAIAVDSSGSSYITGEYMSTVSFGLTTLYYQGHCGNELYLAKISPAGKHEWVKYVGGPDSQCEYGYGLAVDTKGKVYLAGTYSGKTTFGTITKNTSATAFVAQIEASKGGFQWVGTVGDKNTSDQVLITAIAADAAGNSYVTGRYFGTPTFISSTLPTTLPTPTPAIGDVFAAKLNTSGTFVWAKVVGGAANSGRIAVDGTGNSYISGTFSNTMNFGTKKLTSKGSYDNVITKLNINGTHVWTSQGGGAGSDAATGVLTSGGDVFAIGTFDSAAAFGTIAIAGSKTNPFLGKLSSATGTYSKAIAGSWDDGTYSAGAIAPGSGAGLRVAGTFTGTKSFGTTSLTGGGGFVWNTVCHFE